METPSIRVATICQPHATGLGVQMDGWCRNMNPDKVLITDLSELHATNSRNNKNVTANDWFDRYNHRKVKGIPTEKDCRWLLEDIDVLYVVETPLFWGVFELAKEYGVKTCLAYNFEFLEYFSRPVPKPDLFLAPTHRDMDRVKQFGEVKYLPVPIETDRIKRREISKARLFSHIVGHKAHLDRDGTEIVRNSVYSIKNPDVEIKIHDQSVNEVANYQELYERGDVMLLPRRYGYLSLKIGEAAAAGMPTVLSEHDPYAGEGCAITIPGPYQYARLNLKAQIDAYSASPQKLGEVITELSKQDITELSKKAGAWADARSWNVMREQYEQTFETLCASQ